MPYPTYSVNGTPMYDPWGRWHEHREQSTFPVFPGLRAAKLTLAGVGGDVPLPQAPIEGVDFVLRMVVNAVNEFGEWATTYAARLHQLNENVQELLRVFTTAQMTQGGLTALTLHHNEIDEVRASARLEASTEVEFSPGADYLVVHFVFRLPFGVWRGRTVDERFAGSGAKTVAGLARSTAPVDGPHLVLVGPFTSVMVTNEYGNGFRFDRTLGANQAVALNTGNWSASPVFTVEAAASKITAPAAQYAHAPQLSSVGASSGVALTLLPRVKGAVLNVAFTGGSGDTAIHVHTTEAFF